MKTLFSAFLFSVLCLGFSGTSSSSERGGNTGDRESIEQAINERYLFGKCAEDRNRVCLEVSRYLEQDRECRETIPTIGCDFFREVEDYSVKCCSGIDG